MSRGLLRPSLAIGGLLWLAAAPRAAAQVPQVLAFQGKLGDVNGSPLSGNYDFQFSIIPSTGGAAVYAETDGNVQVTNGIYTVYIGSFTAGGIPASTFNVPVVLQIEVNGTLLSPDVPIASVSSAFHAIYADQLLTPMATSSGGTGEDWASAVAGSIPYFISLGSMSLIGPGLNNQVLTWDPVTGGPKWDPSGSGVLTSTNVWYAQQSFDNELFVSTSLALSGPLYLTNSVGSYGQVLESSGPGYAPFWANAPGAGALLSSTNVWTAPNSFENYLQIQNSSLTLAGANGYISLSSGIAATGSIVSQASMTASAFFGDASHLLNFQWNNMQGFPGNCASGAFIQGLSNGTPACTSFFVSAPAHYITEMDAADIMVTASPLYDLNGFIGLGTTAPNAELEISSPALGGLASPVLIVSTGSAASQRLFVVDGNGGVGVGTATPAYNLDVSSYTRINGAVFVGAQTDAWLQANACPPPCFALNSTDNDLYTSTGSAIDQWRNTRTGTGP